MQGRGRGVVRFPGFELDLSSRELRRRGLLTVRLAEKPFLVLEELASRPGEVVTRRELIDKLWPDGTTVDFDNNLNTAVAALREVLDDSARTPRVIETLPRRGYRLIAGPRTRWLPTSLAHVAGVLILLGAAGLFINDADPAGPRRVEDEAKRAFLRGAYHEAGSTAESIERAVAAYREAVAIDPDFAEARAGLADALSRLAFHRSSAMKELLEDARAEARTALRLDDRLPDALRVLALSSMHLDWDFDAARESLESALTADPDDAHTHLAFAAFHSALSHHDEAIAAARHAAELDPASLLVLSDLGFFYLAAGRYGEAIEASRESLVVEPGFIPALRVILTAASRLGRHDEAAAAALQILASAGEPTAELASSSATAIVARFHAWDLERIEALGEDVSPLARALRYAAASHRDRALELLEESFARHEGHLVFLTGFAELAELRSDPRFRAIAERIGLIDGNA